MPQRLELCCPRATCGATHVAARTGRRTTLNALPRVFVLYAKRFAWDHDGVGLARPPMLSFLVLSSTMTRFLDHRLVNGKFSRS